MDYKQTWLLVLRRLEPTIARAKFLTWFRGTVMLAAEEGRLIVGVPSAFVAETLRQKFALKILQAAAEVDSSLKDIEFAVDALLADPADPRTVELDAVFARPGDKKVRRVAGTQTVSVTSEGLRSARLNPRYTLANFIPGDENRLAHAAALSVARLPGQTYNPLFIFGGVGLGKTHLLSAIGHEALTNDPNRVVVYLTAEMFLNEYTAAVRSQKMDDFRRRYRAADLLLVDDIQFFEDREKTQEEFFNLFNALHGAGKQICVTSDRPPSELTKIMDRLRSRFTWGLTAEIEQPSYESRLAILKQKTTERRAILDEEVLDFIAMNVSESVRALEGMLVTALAEADLLHTPPTVRSLGNLLKKLNKKERVVGLPEHAPAISARTPEELTRVVADYFRVPLLDVCGESRQKNYRLARQIAMYLIREILGCGLAQIGQQFRRNHATVLHSLRQIQAGLKTDASLVRHVNAVKKELGL